MTIRSPIPFRERDSSLRLTADVAAGRYPAFVFGAGLGRRVPVFRFAEVTKPYLESYLVYLMQNGYRTLSFEEYSRIVFGELEPPPRSVLLCFDNAWASLWTTAGPLLERYDMRGVAHVIPGRVPDLPKPRPVWMETGHDPDVDHTEQPFCSWKELEALVSRGRIGVQSNTWSHGRIFSHHTFQRLIVPETRMPLLSWPVLQDPGEPVRRLGPSDVFHPLLPSRSRMSDAMKHDVDPLVVRAIHDDPDAAPYLFKKYFMQIETERDREAAIRFEMEASREELEGRLGVKVRHVSFPWGVHGRVAAGLLRDCGYTSAFADHMGGTKSWKPGANPLRMMRLDAKYIRALPGRPRKLFWRLRAG